MKRATGRRLPRRISADESDVGYMAWMRTNFRGARVFVDGVERENVVTADVDAGEVIVLGEIDEASGKRKRTTLRGEVLILFEADGEPARTVGRTA